MSPAAIVPVVQILDCFVRQAPPRPTFFAMIAPSMLLLVLSLAFASAAPTSVATPPSSDAAAASATPQSSTVASDRVLIELTIVNELVGEDAATTEDAVRRTITGLLQGRDFEVGASGEAQLDVVIQRDEANDGIRMQYRARAEGKAPETFTGNCPRCGSDSLAATLAADLEKMSPALTPTRPVPAPVVTPSTSPASDTPRPRGSKRLGPLGIAGVVVGGAGLGVAIGGIILAAIGDSSRVDPHNPAQLEIKRRRTPGFILLGTGAVAAVAGVAMLAVDVSRHRKARRGGAIATRVAEHVSFGSGGFGLRW